MTPEDLKILDEYRELSWTEGWSNEEYFTAGWKAAMKHIQEEKEKWELTSHRRE